MTTPDQPRHPIHVSRVARLVSAVAVLGGAWTVSVPRAQAQAPQPEPYRDPPFTCEVIDYGAEAPRIPAPEDDPLCVRYDKTDITVSTLGAVEFLAAEPARVALVAGKCSYWQQDHWIVRISTDTPALVEWEGSYWYDARSGSAGGIVRGMQVGGQPADGAAFAEAMTPLIGEEAAAELASYAAEGGGGGATFALPEGFGFPTCGAAQEQPPPAEDPEPPGEEPAPAADAVAAPDRSLPATGASPAAGVAALAAVLALAARTITRRAIS